MKQPKLFPISFKYFKFDWQTRARNFEVEESLLPKSRSLSNSIDHCSLEGYAACKGEICQAVSYCLVTRIRQSIASNRGVRHEQTSEPRSNATTPCPVRMFRRLENCRERKLAPVQASISPVFNFDPFQLSPGVYARAHTPPETLCPAAKATSKNICVRPVATQICKLLLIFHGRPVDAPFAWIFRVP